MLPVLLEIFVSIPTFITMIYPHTSFYTSFLEVAFQQDVLKPLIYVSGNGEEKHRMVGKNKQTKIQHFKECKVDLTWKELWEM